MRKSALLILIFLISSCKKEKLTGSVFIKGNYTYAYTTNCDSIPCSTQYADDYGKTIKLIVSEYDHFCSCFSMSTVIQENIIQLTQVVQVVRNFESPCIDGNCNEIYKALDQRGKGYSIAFTFENGVLSPPLNPPYLNIIDFPFEGINKFILE